ncbi:MAG TPA: hypothetical protein VJ396_08530 [Acidiferrobacterales bacterium]|nr:hypothetical protein [Acidiferrobacterales bacterium]
MIRANQVPARNGWGWVKHGMLLFSKAPTLWLAMAFVYLAMAILLSQIPFIGWLILVLLTPLCMLGALPVAHAQDGPGLPANALPAPPAARDLRALGNYLRDLLTRAARRLFSGFKDEDKLLPVMVIGTLLLGGVVIINILAQLLKVGGAALPAMLAGSVGPSVWITALIGLLVVLSLEALLLMAFLYTVPLILFRREHPLPSIELSFSGALNNLGAFAVFASVFAVIGEAMRVLFLLFVFPFDYLVFFLVGLVALPVFIASLHASYQELFTRAK